MKTPPLPLSNRRKRAVPLPPKHLLQPERKIWKAIVHESTFDSEASVALLQATLESHQRARLCRETVDREGATYLDRFDQPKPHPLLAAERDARSAFIAGMKALNLDLVGDVK
jgi:hypothetical protein